MKTSRQLVLSVLAATMNPDIVQSISAADTKNQIGPCVTICGMVSIERIFCGSRGDPIFVKLDTAYPDQIFTTLIWGADRQNIGKLPSGNSRVCAQGVIQDYRVVREIAVHNGGQLRK